MEGRANASSRPLARFVPSCGRRRTCRRVNRLFAAGFAVRSSCVLNNTRRVYMSSVVIALIEGLFEPWYRPGGGVVPVTYNRVARPAMIGTDISAISARLRILRESRGQNQTEFCKSVGLTKAAWNNYETGDRRLSLEAALTLCDETGVTLDWIYRGVKYGLPSALATAIHDIETGKKIHAA